MNDDICLKPASELLELYRGKALSPVEVTRNCLERITALDEKLNAWCLVDEEAALSSARESEIRWMKGQPQGLVDGVPTAIKDLILTRGWPTLRGSRTVNKNQTWDDDAPCVARLREHGAVLIGKTTTPEFGWKGVTDSPLTGITRNPWNVDMTSGGSSGGSASAVATGMAALAIGTDGGGSIRIPCGFTGLVGIKATFGRVPAWPLSPFGTVSHVGPMTRTVTDSALMLSVIGGPDFRDWYELPETHQDYRIGLENGVKGLRIAYSRDLGYVSVDSDIAALVDRAARVFEELGAHVEAVDPGFADPWECFTRTWYAGAANMAATLSAEQRELLDPGLDEIMQQGESFSLEQYMQSQNERGALGSHMRRFHQDFDLLLTPSLPIPAFPAGQEVPDQMASERWSSWTPFTFPFNLTGQPAASVPCGLTPAGLPAGLQIVGDKYDEALVLQACHAFESACPAPLPDLQRL
jgi:aspartyl-tRNA(Asn)/glutamyl-tRNA(Gln) amidotransferase subunit A